MYNEETERETSGGTELILSSGSVSDLPDEFEISMSERDQVVMSASDLVSMSVEYQLFKKCAIEAGYSVHEYQDDRFCKTARFFKPNVEDDHEEERSDSELITPP